MDEGGCERNVAIFFFFFLGGVGGRGGFGRGGRGGCERRIKVFVKNQKKIKNKNFLGGRGVGGSGWGSGWWDGWMRVVVNAMLGVGGDVAYGDVNQE